MSVKGAGKTITQTVSRWPGISTGPHQFGATEFLLNERREIGHIHGDDVVDIPFPRKVRDELVAAGRAQAHAFRPELSAVSFFVREPGDVERAIELLRLSYEIATKQYQRK